MKLELSCNVVAKQLGIKRAAMGKVNSGPGNEYQETQGHERKFLGIIHPSTEETTCCRHGSRVTRQITHPPVVVVTTRESASSSFKNSSFLLAFGAHTITASVFP